MLRDRYMPGTAPCRETNACWGICGFYRQDEITGEQPDRTGKMLTGTFECIKLYVKKISKNFCLEQLQIIFV